MARILRGDIRWAELSPVRGRVQAGRRPVLVLSHDVFNERSWDGHRGRNDQPGASSRLSP